MTHPSIGRGIVALSLVFGVACGPSGPTRLKMKFDVSRKANDDNPLRVDVVVAYDAELVDELDRLTSSEWFDQRTQRMRNNPGGASFSTWRWELTPGLELPPIDEDLPGKPAQGLIYAGYHSRGKHSSRFDPTRAQTVQFRQDGFRVVPGKVTEPEGVRPQTVIGWTCIALGAVGVGLGAFFSVRAINDLNEANKLTRAREEEYNARVSDYEDNRLGMFISYGAGAAFLIAGTVVLLWPESDESPFRTINDDEDDTAGLEAWGIRW